MRSPRLLYWLTGYYLLLSGIFAAAAFFLPSIGTMLPIGGMEDLLRSSGSELQRQTPIAQEIRGLGGSVVWMLSAIIGAVLAAWPVSWAYIEARGRDGYDQSLAETIVLLPLVVTGIVVVVHNSLALAFSLAGIAAGVQFRHALKSSGDLLFILLAIGIGLACGIGAVELAIVLSLAFNYGLLILWINDYGARAGTARYLRKDKPGLSEPDDRPASGEPSADGKL